MKFSGNLDKNLKLMEKFFTEKLDFNVVERPFFIKDYGIEKELYLTRKDDKVNVFVTKYNFDDDEVDFTLQGRPEIANDYWKYILYFLDPEEDKYKNQNAIDEIEDFFKKDKF